MSVDKSEIPERELTTQDVAAQAMEARRPSFLRRHWGKLTVLILLAVPALAVVIWSYAALSFSYSSGNRVGYVQKLSKKGWVCKTWEGELQQSTIPGSAPQLFLFSVRDDSVAHAIQRVVGRLVELQFDQHPGVPLSCFGDTEYFVVGVKPIETK